MDQADLGTQLLALAGRQAPGRLAKHLDLACAGRQRGGQQVEQARLAGPGRTNDGDAFTARNSQVHAAQGVDAVAVLQVRAAQAQAHFSRSAARAASSMPW